MSFRLALTLVAALTAATPSVAQTTCGEGTPIVPIATEEDYARAVAHVVSDYIVPAYDEARCNRRRRWSWRRRAFCEAPDGATRDALGAAFADIVKAWAGVDFFRFGPMARDGRYERFAFFPDVHGTGARQLRRFLASEDREAASTRGARRAERRGAGPAGAGIAALFRLEGLA